MNDLEKIIAEVEKFVLNPKIPATRFQKYAQIPTSNIYMVRKGTRKFENFSIASILRIYAFMISPDSTE